MKKPTKKSTIPALVLGGMLAYGTIGDKVNSEYQNTTQQNAQVETAQTDYKASALENLTQALAPNKAFAQTNQNYQRPDDATLKEWMNQPVEETLAGTNYTKVNDDNYQREVKQADQPVMVLFYANQGEGSTGLAALTKTLHEKFPEIKLCAYKLTDSESISRPEFERLQQNYPLESAPALLFYEEKDFGSGTEFLAQFKGGISTLDLLKDEIDRYYEVTPKYLLD
ncbi:Thioredoxin domain protein [Desulfonatronospira thiodismutans ASO3-1]|uniref:Thioredoxin domain protein n=1 Tax=Desulfonatronospira thiodismutans ASO3-1 TaxID=555779 RepID=D6SPX3_9BACT|nr:thioredoxin [Desulfonatronospira thiodismutans]EFI34799.1 Thioredoxin domain protein [Desulfonatronospira thiodismutans ASO3-1]